MSRQPIPVDPDEWKAKLNIELAARNLFYAFDRGGAMGPEFPSAMQRLRRALFPEAEALPNGFFVIKDETHGFYMTDEDEDALLFVTFDSAYEQVHEWFAENGKVEEYGIYSTSTGNCVGWFKRENYWSREDLENWEDER